MDIFGKTERIIAIALLVLMGVVVASAAVEVAYEIIKGLLEPPGFFLGVIFVLFKSFILQRAQSIEVDRSLDGDHKR